MDIDLFVGGYIGLVILGVTNFIFLLIADNKIDEILKILTNKEKK